MNHVESTDLDPLMQGEAPLPETPPSPQARLDASRAALQMWILQTYHPERLPPPPNGEPAPALSPEGSEPPWLGALIDAVSDVPMAAVAVRYLRRWWARHPLKATAEFADEAGRELLRPVAQRHPWMLLGGAVVTGVVLGQLRPWRWLPRGTLMAGLIPPISLASLLTTFTGMMHGFAPGAPAPEEGPPEPGVMPSETPLQAEAREPA